MTSLTCTYIAPSSYNLIFGGIFNLMPPLEMSVIFRCVCGVIIVVAAVVNICQSCSLKNPHTLPLTFSSTIDDVPIGYPPSGNIHSEGLWCAVSTPPLNWSLKECPVIKTLSNASTIIQVKILTYNLYWWNLFNKNKGGDRSAGKLISRTAGAEGYDILGFQECDNQSRVLADARYEGLKGNWTSTNNVRGISLLYRHDRFKLVSGGFEDVGEDNKKEYYGKRSAVWARLRHETSGIHVFFVNHHGPLPVNHGGACTGSATAYNILRLIGLNARQSDVIILTGDFNAQRCCSSRIEELSRRLNLVYSGTCMGGVDHIFSNCASNDTFNLGKGDGIFKSDHDALSALFTF